MAQASTNGQSMRQTFSLPTPVFNKLQANSKATDRNMSRIITRALEQYLADFEYPEGE